MAEVNVPISLTVESIETGALDLSALKNSLQSHLRGIVEAANKTLEGLDTSKFNASLNKSVSSMINAQQKAANAQVRYNKAVEEAGGDSASYKAAMTKWQNEREALEAQKASLMEWVTPETPANSPLRKLLADYDAKLAQNEANRPNAEEYLSGASEASLLKITQAYAQYTNAAREAQAATQNFQQALKDNKYTDAYAEKVKQMAKLQEKASKLETKAGGAKESGSVNSWIKMTGEANALRSEVAALAREMEDLVRAGEAFRFGGDSTAEFENIQNSVSGVLGSLGDVNATANRSAAAFTMIGKAASNFASSARGAIARVGSALKGFVSQLRQAHKHTNTLGKSMKKFWRYFLMMGLGARSMFFLLRKLRTAAISAIKEMAKAIPEVNTQVSSILTSMNALKGSFSVAFAPLLEPLANMLARIAALAAAAAAAVARLFSAFRGIGYIYSFTAANEDFAKSAEKAGGGADNEVKSLMGFDEINRLDDKSGGGGGGSDSIGTWEKEEFEPSEFLKSIISAWESADFTEVGTVVAKKFASIFDNASNWLNISYGPMVEKIASSLATFINGFTVDGTGLPEAFGRLIGTAINRTVEGLDTFLTTVKWAQAGKFIADGIMNAFDFINWDEIGTTLGNYLLSAITFAWSFISNLDFNKIANDLNTAITTFFDTLATPDESGLTGWQKLGDTIGTSLSGIGDILVTVLSNESIWEGVGTAIGEMIAGIDWDKVFSDLSAIVVAFVNGLGKAFSSWGDSAPISEGIAKMFIGAIIACDIIGKLMPTIVGIMKAVQVFGAFKGIITLVSGIALAVIGFVTAIISFFDQLQNGFNIVKSIFMVLGALIGAVGLVIAGACSWWAVLIAGVVAALAAAFLWARDNWDEICAFVTNLWDSVCATFSSIWETIKSVASTALEFLSSLFDTVWSAIQTTVETVLGVISGVIDDGLEEIKQIVDTVLSTISSTWETIWGTISSVTSTIVGGIKTFIAGVFPGIQSIVTTAATTVQGIWNSAMSAIGSVTSGIWEGIVSTVRSCVNTVIGFLNSMLSGLASGFNGVVSKINSIKFNLPEFLGGTSVGFNLPTIPTLSIPMLANGAVIPPNSEFLAMLGDQKHGTNIEAPLATIEEAVALVMDEYLSGMMAGFESVVNAINNKDMDVVIGDNAIGRAAARYNRKQSVIKGGA